MKHIVAKIMISLAVGIMLMHVVLPHHHGHNSEVGGFLVETELACEDCHLTPFGPHHHDHDDDGPLDQCKLQDQLSKLVVCHRAYEAFRILNHLPECDLFWSEGVCQDSKPLSIYDMGCEWLPALSVAPLPFSAVGNDLLLRAPPAC